MSSDDESPGLAKKTFERESQQNEGAQLSNEPERDGATVTVGNLEFNIGADGVSMTRRPRPNRRV